MSKLPTILGPLLLIALYFSFAFFIRQQFPDPKVFIESIKSFYEVYGYQLIFFGALLEALFLIGLYLPGATVVLLGAALSRSGVVSFPLVFVLGTAGLLIGYTINYVLGRYGWYHVLTFIGLEQGVKEAEKKIERHGIQAIFLGYFFPGGASFLSTAAGILQMPFRTFLFASVVAQGFWGILWGSLAYLFGLPLVEFLLKYFIFVLLGLLVFWIVRKVIIKK